MRAFLSDWLATFVAIVVGVVGMMAFIAGVFYAVIGWVAAIAVTVSQPWWAGVLAWLSWLAVVALFTGPLGRK